MILGTRSEYYCRRKRLTLASVLAPSATTATLSRHVLFFRILNYKKQQKLIEEERQKQVEILRLEKVKRENELKKSREYKQKKQIEYETNKQNFIENERLKTLCECNDEYNYICKNCKKKKYDSFWCKSGYVSK